MKMEHACLDYLKCLDYVISHAPHIFLDHVIERGSATSRAPNHVDPQSRGLAWSHQRIRGQFSAAARSGVNEPRGQRQEITKITNDVIAINCRARGSAEGK